MRHVILLAGCCALGCAEFPEEETLLVGADEVAGAGAESSEGEPQTEEPEAPTEDQRSAPEPDAEDVPGLEEPEMPAEVPLSRDGDLQWVRLPAGTFAMGSDLGDADEQPARAVSVQAFEISKTEVTVAQYRACVEAGACAEPYWEAGGCTLSGSGSGGWEDADLPLPDRFRRDDHPQVCVNWFEARAYAEWVGGRLPTEAEWEYAARGGQDVAYPWGDEAADCTVATFAPDGCYGGGTARVCSRPDGNTLHDLCDMAGNVWEWTEDAYVDFALAPTDGSAQAEVGDRKVTRGGSWWNGTWKQRTTKRSSDNPGFRNDRLGFRIARDIDP